LDGDGDLDIITTSQYNHAINWHENRLIGDVNDDGRFDSSDIVRVFQMGQYEDGVRGNSTFDEGDWNHDGDFTSADLVLAFQSGRYERSANANFAQDVFGFLAHAAREQSTNPEWGELFELLGESRSRMVDTLTIPVRRPIG
jgi:hypothetical protein